MPASSSDLIARVTALFARDLKVEPPTPETDLFEVGALDSLAFVTLLTGLEREFGVRVPVEDLELEHFTSIGSIARFISSRMPVNDDVQPRAARR